MVSFRINNIGFGRNEIFQLFSLSLSFDSVFFLLFYFACFTRKYIRIHSPMCGKWWFNASIQGEIYGGFRDPTEFDITFHFSPRHECERACVRRCVFDAIQRSVVIHAYSISINCCILQFIRNFFLFVRIFLRQERNEKKRRT